MERWRTIETIHGMTSEFKFLCNELGEMKSVWDRTKDNMCNPERQQFLQRKLDRLCEEIKKHSELL